MTLLHLVGNTPPYEPLPPEPIVEDIPEGIAFPLEAMGPLREATLAIAEITQAPLALCAQSILAATAVAVQSHLDCEGLDGARKPSALFVLSVAQSGERKSSADRLAMKPIKDHEKAQRALYQEAFFKWKNSHELWERSRADILKSKKNPQDKQYELETLGQEPKPPYEPILVCEEPSYQALQKLLERSRPSIGLFSDEGAEFLGGHALRNENRMQTIAGLSRFWDGSDAKRLRVSDGHSLLTGKRLSMHLMVQPNIALSFLNDPLYQGQGFLSRFLVSYPPSTMGTRYWKEPSAEAYQALEQYCQALSTVLNVELPLNAGGDNELQPRVVTLSPEAKAILIGYHDCIEAQLGPFGDFTHIRGFAAKAVEHAVRLATILAGVEDIMVTTLSGNAAERGVELCKYYLSEAQRLFMAGHEDEEAQKAQTLLDWLLNKWSDPHISWADISKYAPAPYRSKSKTEPLLAQLVSKGWLEFTSAPVAIKGHTRKESWQINRGNQG